MISVDITTGSTTGSSAELDLGARLAGIEDRIATWDLHGARTAARALLDEPALSPDDRLTTRRLLAEALRELGDLDAAYDLAEAVAGQAEQAYGPADVSTVHAWAVLAAVRHDYDEWDAAEALYHRVLDSGVDETDPVTGPEAVRVIRLTRVNLALLQRDRGERALALAMLNAAYVVHRREYGADDLDTIRIAAELAALHHADGNVPASRRLFTVAHAAARARLGTRHPFTKAVEWELAAVEPPMPASLLPPAPPSSPTPAPPSPRPAPAALRSPSVAPSSSGRADRSGESAAPSSSARAGRSGESTAAGSVPAPSSPVSPSLSVSPSSPVGPSSGAVLSSPAGSARSGPAGRAVPAAAGDAPDAGDASFGDEPDLGDAAGFGDEPDLGDAAGFGDEPDFGDTPDLGDEPDFGDASDCDDGLFDDGPAGLDPGARALDLDPDGAGQAWPPSRPQGPPPVGGGSGALQASSGALVVAPAEVVGGRFGAGGREAGMRVVVPLKAVAGLAVGALVIAGVSVLWPSGDDPGRSADRGGATAPARGEAGPADAAGADGQAGEDAGVPTARVLDLRLQDDGTALAVSWTGLEEPVVVALSRAGGPPVVVAEVPPGTTTYVLKGVDPVVAYCVVVGPVDATVALTPATSVCTGRR